MSSLHVAFRIGEPNSVRDATIAEYPARLSRHSHAYSNKHGCGAGAQVQETASAAGQEKQPRPAFPVLCAAISANRHGPHLGTQKLNELFRDTGRADRARTPLNLIARAATSPTAVALAARDLPISFAYANHGVAGSMRRAGVARAGCPVLLQLAFREWKGHD